MYKTTDVIVQHIFPFRNLFTAEKVKVVQYQSLILIFSRIFSGGIAQQNRRRIVHNEGIDMILIKVWFLYKDMIKGRQRMRWKDAVSRDLQDTDLSFHEATVAAQDRKKCRSYVLALYVGSPHDGSNDDDD